MLLFLKCEGLTDTLVNVQVKNFSKKVSFFWRKCNLCHGPAGHLYKQSAWSYDSPAVAFFACIRAVGLATNRSTLAA